MARRRTDSLIFDTLRLEGGLFVPAVLEKAAHGDLAGQRAADYRLPKGLTLTDEQGRAFRIASALQKTFDPVRARQDVDAARATAGFVLELLRDAFGFADIAPASRPATIADRDYPISAFAAGGRIPVIVAPHDLDLDIPDERFAIAGSGARKRSAYQLAQQFLNASVECTWALVVNGRQLRLVRDADTLTRPAYLEADLDLILRDQRYPDFAAIWRLFHASRAGVADAPAGDSPWESWRKEGQEQGERVRAGLRIGVTEALLALGTGFLAHPANEALRQNLQDGKLTKDAYFQQLLRLVYRCLFLFTVEERGLLHGSDNSPAVRAARDTYAQGYAFRRLRERALRRAGLDRHGDLWAGIQVVFRGLASGEPRLALPALGGLFSPKQCPDLDAAKLENRALLSTMRKLRWSKLGGALAPIDYRNMGPEELGSVYESLLELVPAIDLPARSFGFVGLTEAGSTDGNARKTSGSYYTPDSLVQELLNSALDPVIEQKIAAAPADPAAALLSISVIDPACGSGHFLLAAARRLAERLAELRAVEGAVTPADYRNALHEVIAHCIHGVDRNPMALELARTALWLEGFKPDQPLSFLDHHLVCGDALLGLMDFQALAKGIPQDAFTALTGDAKPVVKALATANRAALKELGRSLQNTELFAEQGTADLLAELRQIEAMPEITPAEVEVKASAHEAFLRTARDSRLAVAADLYVAAFLCPKANETDASRCPTTRTLGDLLFPRADSPVPPDLLAAARDTCHQARVLHWPLAFAGVFARGRFDCVLGNPPWDMLQLDPQEYFSARAPEIADAKNMAARDLAIEELRTAGSPLFSDYSRELRLTESIQAFVHASERFRHSGTGRINLASLFTESCLNMIGNEGRAGIVSPSGLATDSFTQHLWNYIADGRLCSLFDMENREGVFPDVDGRTKFCLLTLGKGATPVFAFYLTRTQQIADARRRFTLSKQDFELINPNTRTCPIFRSNADAELTKSIYLRCPVLVREERDEVSEQNPWGIDFQLMFMMNTDSRLFLDSASETALPLYEAKMIHQFDHRWATYVGRTVNGRVEIEAEDVNEMQRVDPGFTVRPRYWVEERHVLARLSRVPRCVTKAWEKQDETELLAAFATWIEAAHADDALAGFSVSSSRKCVIETGGRRFEALPASENDWLDDKSLAEARNWPPLASDELAFLRDSQPLFQAAHAILDARSPRWLMGWRDITNATNERTVIASVLPRMAVGNKIPLILYTLDAPRCAALLGNLNCMVLDYVARQKVGGTTLNFYLFKQFAVLPPSAFSQPDLSYITPRVLELTYTSHDLAPWAADLGHKDPPFAFDPARRAQLRAELDAYYARLYGLSRDELRYILDPADTHGPDYPTETFRGLKTNELRAFGEYRTRRLVLEAWDLLALGNGASVSNAT
ncbi:MAG: hypothetical protein RL324_706 [Verrucomicrobiota bacterium]|jgi:hypothetical protein